MRKIIYLVILVVLFSGCAIGPTYIVGVDSINDGEKTIDGKKCIVFSGMENTPKEDLQFKEYERYITKTLTNKGYAVTDNPDDAEIEIFLSYGIGDPKTHTFTYSVPILGQTGISSAQTFGSVQGFGNSATYSGTTTYTPSYGVVGTRTGVREETTYTRYIRLDAYDLVIYRESKKEKHLWKTDIISTGSSGDLRRVFPIMVAAAAPYVGENTQSMKEIELGGNDKRVLQIFQALLK